MKETIYLYANKYGIDRMRKTLTDFKRGEIPIKLIVEVDDNAFGIPSIEKYIIIDDWGSAVDIEDVNFDKNIITPDEANIIKNKRIEKMKQILESQGYEINKKKSISKQAGDTKK